MNCDFLIAGQGIAGSLLAKALHDKGASVIVVDPLPEVSASLVAAGILHPLTGRRIARTWMADTLIPFAVKHYNNFQDGIFHSIPILEIFTSVQQRNEWQNKSAEDSHRNWIGKTHASSELADGVTMPFGGIEVINTGWLDVHSLVMAFRAYYNQRHLLIRDEIAHKDVTIKGSVRWKDYHAHKIIYCNGWKASLDPLFSWLPFVPAKGEIMEVHCPGLSEEYILNRGIYLIPSGNHKFKVGATHEWEDLSEKPTEDGIASLCTSFEKVTSLPYSITWKAAAVRPANKDRRPFIGSHPEHSEVGIFNGLGTKGAMLAPWFAEHYAEHLINGKLLLKDADISRYYSAFRE